MRTDKYFLRDITYLVTELKLIVVGQRIAINNYVLDSIEVEMSVQILGSQQTVIHSPKF